MGVSLRDVTLDDVDAYVRMRCDPVMMAELGGPLPRDGIEAKVERDVAYARDGTGWILMIVPDEDPAAVAGSVVVWSQDGLSEIGWMVLPEYQGRGIAKEAVRQVLDRARANDRWGVIHAHPGMTNGPSNGICRSLGFTLVGEKEVDFSGRMLHVNHWQIDPRGGVSSG